MYSRKKRFAGRTAVCYRFAGHMIRSVGFFFCCCFVLFVCFVWLHKCLRYTLSLSLCFARLHILSLSLSMSLVISSFLCSRERGADYAQPIPTRFLVPTHPITTQMPPSPAPFRLRLLFAREFPAPPLNTPHSYCVLRCFFFFQYLRVLPTLPTVYASGFATCTLRFVLQLIKSDV